MKNVFIGTLLVLLSALPIVLSAQQQQDITGMWKGEIVLIRKDTADVHLPYEIAVSEAKGKLKGYSRIIFTEKGKEEAGMEGISMKWKGNELIIEDDGFIEHDFSINPSKRVKKTSIVTLTITETEMILSGIWSTNRTRYYLPGSGTITLKRKADFKESVLFKRLDTLKIAPQLSFTQPKKIVEPTVAVNAPPVEKKQLPPTPDEPVVEPELIIPPISKAAVELLPLQKNKQAAIATIVPPSRQKKAQMDALAKSTIKYTPKVVPPPVAIEKPAPEVAIVTKPEKKPVPVVVKPTPPPAEKKPVEVVKAPPPAPKPTPPPVAVVAPSITQGAAEIEKRSTKSQNEVYFESDSLSLTLYDNGDVDGDVVTVLMNGNIIFSKQLLSTKATTKIIYAPKDLDSIKLVMYAENLGDIPPNTGLLIVMDGEKRFEVRFSADLQTNAAIMLRRKRQ
jgi:hypothetical protein